MNAGNRLDGLALVGVAFCAFMVLNVLKDQGLVQVGFDPAKPLLALDNPESQPSAQLGLGGAPAERIERASIPALDSNAIAAPYNEYIVTQGLHGEDYGHLAVDLSAGVGAPILSPINGWVADVFIDEWGNPSLILENERYQVELLHGLYSVKIGDQVLIGQPIGTESNQGNVADAWGRPCRVQACGYHTHINVFDKQQGMNVNPLRTFQVP